MENVISEHFWCETSLCSSPVYSKKLVEELLIYSYYLLLPSSLELEKQNKESLLKRTESKLQFWKLPSSEDQTEHTSSKLNLWSQMEYYTNWNIIKGCKIKQLPWQKDSQSKSLSPKIYHVVCIKFLCLFPRTENLFRKVVINIGIALSALRYTTEMFTVWENSSKYSVRNMFSCTTWLI